MRCIFALPCFFIVLLEVCKYQRSVFVLVLLYRLYPHFIVIGMMINYIKELRQQEQVNGIYDCLRMNKCLRAYVMDNIQLKKGGQCISVVLFGKWYGMNR